MKFRLSQLIFVILIFVSIELSCQNTIDSISLTDKELRIERIVDDNLIKEINKESIRIDELDSISSRSKVETRELRISTEGGVAKYQYDENCLKRIIFYNYGEMGEKTSIFYLILDQPFLVHELSYKYNRPIYWDEKMMRENNDNETFDINKTVMTEVKSYFIDGKLFTQIHNPNLESSDKNLIEEQTRILEEYVQLVKAKNNQK